MRPLAALPIVLLLCSCASEPLQQSASTAPSQDQDAGKNWCQRNPGACLPLLPLAVVAWIVDGLVKAAPQAAADTIANTTMYNSTVRTPSGTYDGFTTCTTTGCDSTVSKRK